jgi:MFS family permease
MPDQTPDALPWRSFVPVLAVQFIGTLGYSIAIPFLVFLVVDFGGEPWTYGFIGAIYSACQLVGAPILGRWSDRAGRRPVLLMSQAGTMVAWLVFLVALALPLTPLVTLAGATITLPLALVVVARAVDGLTGGNISVANAYVADLTQGDKESRRVAFGRTGMAASLGFALGPAIAGLLGALGDGYTAPVIAAAAISGVATLLCLTLREPNGRCPEGPRSQPCVTRTMETLRKPAVLGLLSATFVLFLAFNLFYAAFPVHASLARGWDASQMGMFFTIMAGVMIVAQGPLLQAVSARASGPTVFAIGIGMLALSFVGFALPSDATMIASAAAFAIGNGLSWPTFQARLSDSVSDEEQGAVQGAATSAGSAASIVGLVLGGALYGTLEAWLFVAGAALFVVVGIGTPIWFRDAER